MMRAISTMQTAGHNKSHDIGRIVPALAKIARTGHPQFLNVSKHFKNSGPPANGMVRTSRRSSELCFQIDSET
jgi:hypothetical protein